jgi:hypothetical protein
MLVHVAGQMSTDATYLLLLIIKARSFIVAEFAQPNISCRSCLPELGLLAARQHCLCLQMLKTISSSFAEAPPLFLP